MSHWVMLLVLISAALAGCSTTYVPQRPTAALTAELPPSKLHTIYVDKRGYLLDPKSRERISSTVPASPRPTPASESAARMDAALAVSSEELYVNAIVDNFLIERRRQPGLELTVHVHGGLNLFDDAIGRSDRFSSHMLAERHYPVFVGWPSGPATTYWDHLFVTKRGEGRNEVETVLIPSFVLLEDLCRAAIRLPIALGREVRETLRVLRSVTSDSETTVDPRANALRAMNDGAGFNVVSEPPFTGVGGDYWSVGNPFKLLGGPLVDGFGSGPWDEMLRRTDLVLTKPSVFESKPADAVDPGAERGGIADTAVSRFLKAWMNRPETQDVKVNLIGHSMGAIVALNMLSRYPALKVDNVVFMGAAARIKDYERILVPWMQRTQHKDARFYNLSLDPYNEMAERNAWDFAPRGSLLNWIDNFLAEVNSFTDRTAGSWVNIMRTAGLVFPANYVPPGGPPMPVSSRVTLKRFPIGRDIGPQKHGDFDDYCFWREAYWSSKADSLPFTFKGDAGDAKTKVSCVGREFQREEEQEAVLAK